MRTFREKLRQTLAYITLSVAFMLFATMSFAQNMIVKGSITDSNGAMIGASVMVEGTQTGTVTDFDGTFTLPNVPSDGVLTFSYIGYNSQSLPVVANKEYNVVLEEDLNTLDEVIVVGYEVKKKSVVTGAIGSLNSEELQQAKPTNAVSALTGRVSGVTVIASSGNPGKTPDVYIRGVGTNGDSSPLYVVDGLQMSDLSGLNPNDIASMEVLKDATSTAIYGARGANGVILVTTKKGTPGRTTVTYDGYYGVASVQSYPDMMDAEEYIWMVNTFAENSNDYTDYVDKSEWDGTDTNWFDVIFNSVPVQEHNVSFSQAGEKGSSVVSLGYLDQNGIIGGDKSGYKRFTIRNGNDYSINDYLRIGSNLNVVYKKTKTLSTGTHGWNPIRYAYNQDPICPVYDENSDDSEGYGVSGASGGDTLINPLAFIDACADAYNNVLSANGNVYLEVKPIEGLTLRTDLGANTSYTYNRSYTDSYFHHGNFSNDYDTVTNYSALSFGWQWENTAVYRFTVAEKHNFSVLGGISALQSDWEYATTSRTGIAAEAVDNEAYRYLNAGDSSTASNAGYASATHTMESFFGRLSYNYDEKYMAELVVRRDGSSNFAAGNKYGTFPGASIGWNISREDFWDVNNFDTLKFRASWGQNGNESIDAFSYTSIVGSTYYTLGDSASVITGAAPESLSNPDIKWETSEQTNIGIDMSFFGGKLSGSFDWYNKVTRDLLMESTVSSVYGSDGSYVNAGQISNRGIEFMVNYRNNIKDLNYGISFNASMNNNNVDEVGNANGYIDGGYWLNQYYVTRMEEGHALSYFRLYETDGIFSSQEEIDNYTDASGNKIQPDAQPGDFKWVDYNGDGQITDDDRHDMGNPWAKWTFGTNINLEYKGLDLTMNLVAKTNFKVMNASIRNINYGIGNLPTYYLDCWSETNLDATIPRYLDSNSDTNGNFEKPSDFFLFDGDYLSINLLEVGYTLPKSITTKALISNMRVYVACDNLTQFNDYPYMTTEVADMTNSSDVLETGIDYGVYPVARTVRVGVNVTF